MTLRSATATAKYNEITLFTGSTASQTISAPASPIDSVCWSIINNSSVNVTLGFSANAMYVLGANTSVTTYTVTPGSAYSFVNYNGGNWYMTSTNDLTNGTGVLPTTNGGTGLSTIGTAGQVLTVNSGATGLQYSTPTTTTSVTMGGDVTGNSATSTVAKINGTTLGTLSGATSGQALAWNGSSWVPTTISGGAPGTTVKSFIATDFSITSSNTVYDVTSISLTAGTWLVNYQALINRGSNGYFDLWIGTTSGSSTGEISGITIFTTAAAPSGAGAGAYSVTVASTTTLYLQVLGNNPGTVTVAGYTGRSTNTSGLTAVRTA